MSTFSVQGLPRSTSGAAHEKVPTWMHSQIRVCHTLFTYHTTMTAATGILFTGCTLSDKREWPAGTLRAPFFRSRWVQG